MKRNAEGMTTQDDSPRWGWWVRSLALTLLLAGALLPGPVRGEGGDAAVIPHVIDPDRRIERSPGTKIATIRFVTEEDYPPFNYRGRDGALAGFNVDLASEICTELGAQCTIQPRAWSRLLPALDAGEADAAIAAHRITPDLRREYEVSLPTHRSPARFIGRKEHLPESATLADLAGKTVAIVGGTSHEAFLNAFFPKLSLRRFETIERALESLRRGEADLAFGDGIAIAFWLNGSESLGCCAFFGGPYTESRYFGEGAGIVMRHGNEALRQAIDFALWRISRDGRYAKLYLKHFPIPFY